MEPTPQQLGQSLYRLGRQLLNRKHFDEARESFTLSLQFAPDSAAASFELGNLLHAAGHHGEAADRYVHALNINPRFAEAWYNLGVVRMILRDLGKSRICFEQALAIHPQYAEAHNNLAILMQASGQIEEALDHYHEAARIQPAFLEPQYNLGLVLQERQEFEACAETYQKLIGRQPDHVDARNNLANVLLELGKPQDARTAYQQVLALDPSHPEANWNLGLVQLQLGDWARGWRNYEWRFRQPTTRPEFPRTPRWNGESLKGRTIVLTAEQGLGDMLQFLRYIPILLERGPRIWVECHQSLTGIVSRMPGVEGVVPKGEPLPDHHCWAPLMSLPAILRLADPPADTLPYVTVDPERQERWKTHLQQRPATVRIGVNWSGNPQFKANQKRSLADVHVRALTNGMPQDLAFYSLQKGMPMVQGANLIALDDDPASMEDVAAIINSLDLVISTDTSIAHLAGALAKPAWILLAHSADWRWMTGREDSPWYPAMRLFRQPSRGDWDSVIEAVRRELALLLN